MVLCIIFCVWKVDFESLLVLGGSLLGSGGHFGSHWDPSWNPSPQNIDFLSKLECLLDLILEILGVLWECVFSLDLWCRVGVVLG